jgi:pyrroline-5-carboxylate reductase
MTRIGFIGAGKMAEALIKSIVEIKEEEYDIIASDISETRLEIVGAIGKVKTTKDNSNVISDSDIIFIAVKPQNIREVLNELAETEKLVISIAAGISIDILESYLLKARVIRIMPNIPCLVGEMAGGFALGTKATKKDREILENILKNAGRIHLLSEKQLDAVTALSGSGPAFISYIINAMVEGAVIQGLPSDIASKLTIQTILGTGKLLRDTTITPKGLISMVSSPGGTTEAGLLIFEKSALKKIIERTIIAATEKSKELRDKVREKESNKV